MDVAPDDRGSASGMFEIRKTRGGTVRVKETVRENDGEREELVLTIVATAEEVDEYSKKFFKDIAKRDIPGFRKGKAPRAVLEQSVGGHANAMGGVAEMLINEQGFKAIDDSGVIFIDEPEFNVEDMLEEGKPFTFTVSGLVAPLMSLSSYEPVSIEMPSETATEQEIDDQIRELQEHYHSLEKITDEDHVAADGDYVEVIMTITNDGKTVSSLRGAKRMIGLGAGTMPASFDAQIIGTKVGDILDFDFEAKDEDGSSRFGDGNLHANVEVTGFRKMILPEGEELAGKVGCANMEELRNDMAMNINMQKSKDLPKVKVDRCVEALIARLEAEVPEYYIDFIRQDVGREMMQSFEKKGTTLQEWVMQNNVEAQQLKESVSREAVRRAAIDCALEALFVEKKMEITEEDIAKFFEGDDEAGEARKAWEDANRMANVHKMCRQSKASQWLVDTAEVTIA